MDERNQYNVIMTHAEKLNELAGRGILIEIFFFVCHGHTCKLFHFVYWFQNCFRFRSRTFPSHGGKFLAPGSI